MNFRIKKNIVQIIGILFFLSITFFLGNLLQKQGGAWNPPVEDPPLGNIPFIGGCRWAISDGSCVAPQNVKSVALGLKVARISWTAMPGMNSYKISVGPVAEGPFTEITSVLHPIDYYDVENLSSEGEYYFVVQSSTNGETWSDYSAPTYIKMPVPPGVPHSLSIGIYSETALDLSWTAPEDDGGSDIVGYKIERNDGGIWATIVEDTGTVDTTYRNTGLTENIEYGYRISTITSEISDPSYPSYKYSGHCYSTNADCAINYVSILGGSQSGCTTVGPVNSPYAGSGNDRYRIMAINSDPASCGSCLTSNPSYDQVRQAQVSLDSGANYTDVGSQYVCRTQRAGSTCMWSQFGFYYTIHSTCVAGSAQCGSPAYSQCTGCNSSCSCSSNSCSACATTRVCTNQTTTIRWCCRN